MIITMAKKRGRPTSSPERTIVCIFFSGETCRLRWVFSTKMIDASAIRPMLMASPPRDIKSAARFILCIRMKVKRIEKGKEKTAIRAEGKSPIKRKRTRMTRTIPRIKLVDTVEKHFLTKAAWL